MYHYIVIVIANTERDLLRTVINNYSPKWRWLTVVCISTTFTDTEVNKLVYSFSIYHTSLITRGPKSNFICDNIRTKAIMFFFGCSEVNSTWLITSELSISVREKYYSLE